MSNFVSLDNRSLMLDHGLDVISGRFLFYLVAAFTLSVGILKIFMLIKNVIFVFMILKTFKYKNYTSFFSKIWYYLHFMII